MELNQVQQENSPYKIKLEIFEGPLDLLLHLIRENEIDIYDIPIAKVTEQYLTYLSLMEALDLEVAGEWLVMAATLIEIKSRMLLPEETREDAENEEVIDPRLELVERLIEYEKFKSAAEVFREREEERSKVFIRGALDVDFDLKPTVVLDDIKAVDLLNILQSILSEDGDEDVTTIQRRKVTVQMRMREIWRRLERENGQLSFDDLVENKKDRMEVVFTFLALLELLKSRKIKVKQKKAFSPIQIIPLSEANGR